MMDNLFEYVNTLETEIHSNQMLFFREWNNQIKAHLEVSPGFQIEKYVDVFGGYWLDTTEYNAMDNQLRTYYDSIAIRQDRVYLRGYEYYQVDPLFHMQHKLRSIDQLWMLFRDKWNRYSCISDFSYINEKIKLENWIGTLGLLEYMFSDLTSLRWFVFRNKNQDIKYIHDNYDELVNLIERFTEVIGQAIAAMLLFDFDNAFTLLSTNYKEMINSCLINKMLGESFENVEKASLRAMREGDSIVLIYAAYIMKLNPFCAKHQGKKILLISNAFGAMNIGIILKHLLAGACSVNHVNLLFAQHRSEGDFVYGDLLTNQCYFFNDKDKYETQHTDITIVVDDSVCFGKSFFNIKKVLNNNSIYLLPLTLNCNGMKYFRVGINENDNISEIIEQSASWARDINNRLPSFFSFWDFRQHIPEECLVKDETQRFALYGSDLLLKHLWTLYAEVISSDE